VSGKENEGFTVAFSNDTMAQIQGTLDGCGQADDQCYQSVREILQAADLQVDSKLDRRGFIQFLMKAFKKMSGVFGFATAALFANWHQRQKEVDELGIFIPETKASEASAFATATEVVVSAGGSPILTITPTPDPTSIQG
jgi:hypothetical protein